MDLLHLAKKLRTESYDDNDMADFIRLVGGENDLNVLKSLLSARCVECNGPILERLLDLLPNDPKLYVSLAVWRYQHGLDEQAAALLDKAKSIAPSDHDVLRADVWFSYGDSASVLTKKCETLLQRYSTDKWAKRILDTLRRKGTLHELRGPEWDSPWERAIATQ